MILHLPQAMYTCYLLTCSFVQTQHSGKGVWGRGQRFSGFSEQLRVLLSTAFSYFYRIWDAASQFSFSDCFFL